MFLALLFIYQGETKPVYWRGLVAGANEVVACWAAYTKRNKLGSVGYFAGTCKFPFGGVFRRRVVQYSTEKSLIYTYQKRYQTSLRFQALPALRLSSFIMVRNTSPNLFHPLTLITHSLTLLTRTPTQHHKSQQKRLHSI